VKDRFAHVFWFVFRVGYAGSCESVAERVIVSSEVGVFGECCAVFNVWAHGAV
jgi:hypothetical protein